MINLTCDQCGKTFEAKPYKRDKFEHHFCSQKCYGLWQRKHRKGVGRKRITTKCANCGKTLHVQPHRFKKHKHLFCDTDCYAEYRKTALAGENGYTWLGGHDDYRGPNWDEQRQRVLERDSHTCQRCGATDERLEVHHKRPYHLFDNYLEANRLSNLDTLCVHCHGTADAEFWHEHPELIGERRYPYTEMDERICERCGQSFTPRSPATKICDDCCTFTCAHCGEQFYTRKHSDRSPKYCSRECRNADVATDVNVCPDCGGWKHYEATRCRDCDTIWYRTHPEAPRRGRKPKSEQATTD